MKRIARFAARQVSAYIEFPLFGSSPTFSWSLARTLYRLSSINFRSVWQPNNLWQERLQLSVDHRPESGLRLHKSWQNEVLLSLSITRFLVRKKPPRRSCQSRNKKFHRRRSRFVNCGRSRQTGCRKCRLFWYHGHTCEQCCTSNERAIRGSHSSYF